MIRLLKEESYIVSPDVISHFIYRSKEDCLPDKQPKNHILYKATVQYKMPLKISEKPILA